MYVAHLTGIDRISLDSHVVARVYPGQEILAGTAAHSLACYQGGVLFTVLKEHRILRYSGTDDRIYPFAGSGKEGNSDGLHNTCEFYQPTGIGVEYDNVVYVCDTQTSCINILTTLRKTSNFLNAIEKLFSAFSVHEKKKTYSLKSIAEAEALVKECKQF